MGVQESDKNKPTGADEHGVDLGKSVVEGILPPMPSKETASVDNTTPQKLEPKRPPYLQKYIELAKGILSDDEFNDFSTAIDQYHKLEKEGIFVGIVASLDNALEFNEKFRNVSDNDKVNSVWAICLMKIIDAGKSSNFFKDFRKELECRLDWSDRLGSGSAEERILFHCNEIMDKRGWGGFIEGSSDPLLGDLLKACRMLTNGNSQGIKNAYKQLEKLFSEAENKNDKLVCRICLNLLLDDILYRNTYYFEEKSLDCFAVFTDKSELEEKTAYYEAKRAKIAPQDDNSEPDDVRYSRVVFRL